MIKGPSDISTYDAHWLRGLLEQMLLIRRFEEQSAQLYGLRKIGGFCHLYIGQEAVAVGAVAALDLHKDYLITAYRDHGHALAVGMDPNAVMAELCGKAAGCSRGKGGSMHLFDAQKHFLGGHGIVGAHIPLAAGVALKIKYRDEDGVVLCFFGDGAIHQGSFHETLNMARVWNLPVIFVCENNQYGMGTDFRRVSAITDLYRMAQSYDMPGEQVDGMDVLAVHEAFKLFAQKARNGTPGLIEAVTYRYMGHSMSDPATYRTRDELNQYKQQDPILLLKARMLDADKIDNDAFDKLDKTIKDRVNQAVQFAQDSEEPAIQTLYEDVLVE